MHTSPIAAVVLAAGKGTRMCSTRPKVLHTLLGSAMLAYVFQALKPIAEDNILAVYGYQAQILASTFPEIKYVLQKEQLGTGHALKCALPVLEDMNIKQVLVINGDTPLITTSVIENFITRAAGAKIAFATITLADAGFYGRVIRKGDCVTAIVEAREFSPELHGPETGEVNAGLYLVDLASAVELLPEIGNANKSGEYYLTDLISLGIAAGLPVKGICCGNDTSLLGVNSPLELSEAEDILATRTCNKLLADGVIIHNPHALRASPFAEIEPGAEISAPCEIYGRVRIEHGARIDPFCVLIDTAIASGTIIRPFCHLENAQVGPDCMVGPYTRLRPGARLEDGAHAGNFVELKKATLGKGSKANHLTYLGDAEIGENVNIGAGTITCNYDGKQKFRTQIGDRAFIGSNSALVAPVDIGADTLIGAGSVITRDVPAGDLALGRARQVNKTLKK